MTKFIIIPDYSNIGEITDFQSGKKTLADYFEWIKKCHSWTPDQKVQMEAEQKEFKDFMEGEKVVIMHVYSHPAGNGSWTIVTNYGRVYHMHHTRLTVYRHYDYWMAPEKIIQLKSRCESFDENKLSFEGICDFVELELKSISIGDYIKKNKRLEKRCGELEAKMAEQSQIIEMIRSSLKELLGFL